MGFDISVILLVLLFMVHPPMTDDSDIILHWSKNSLGGVSSYRQVHLSMSEKLIDLGLLGFFGI